MSMCIKLGKAQTSKIIHWEKFLGNTLGNMTGKLGKKALLNLTVPLAKNIFPKLACKAISSILDKFDWKISGQVY